MRIMHANNAGRVLFCLEDQVAPPPKKLQKAPHNSTVGERVENVTVLSRESTYDAENTLTSVLITPGFIFVIYMPGYWLFTKIEGCGNLTNLRKGMQRVYLVNNNLYGPNLSNNWHDQIIFHEVCTTFQLPHTVLFALFIVINRFEKLIALCGTSWWNGMVNW